MIRLFGSCRWWTRSFRTGQSAWFQVGPRPGKASDEVAGFLMLEPFTIAPLFPVGEVLFVDGTGVEVQLEGVANLREAVEPEDELVAWLTVLEAAVELVADAFREAGNFAGAGGIHGALGLGCLALIRLDPA